MSRGRAASIRRKPNQERSRTTVEAIVEAAAQVFARHGYAAGTTNRIAARAGVSVGSLYQYFADKDAVLAVLAHRHLEEGARRLEPLLRELQEESPSVERGIHGLVEAMVELHRTDPGLHRVLFEESPRLGSVRREAEQLERAGREAVAAWLDARPEVTVSDPALAAELCINAVESVTHRLVIDPGAGPPRAYVEETARMLTAYLTRD